MSSPAYDRFKASMVMDFDKWHDGLPYDIDALTHGTDLLPTLIDHLTPKGQVPAEGLGTHDDLLSSLSGLLQKS